MYTLWEHCSNLKVKFMVIVVLWHVMNIVETARQDVMTNLHQIISTANRDRKNIIHEAIFTSEKSNYTNIFNVKWRKYAIPIHKLRIYDILR